MQNFATPDGTTAYALRMQKNHGLPPTAFERLGRTGLTISKVGFGCYRIDDENGTHLHALDLALRSGCNLIDTSTNYTDGASERCVGAVIKSLLSQKTLSREEVVVVSKVGYVQGENLTVATEKEAQGNAYQDMVKYGDGCWHCIHPTFIADQITRSLERTGLNTIDVYLLHNPEYFFSDQVQRQPDTDITILRKEFYARIETAFAHLETEVTKGRIHAYGVSSNTFGKDTMDQEMTSVSRMWEIAERLQPGKHSFAVIQCPINLFESGPVLEKNNHGKSTLEFAKEVGLAVLVNRPLNAFAGNQLVRLADFAKTNDAKPFSDLIKMVQLMEQEFIDLYAPTISTAADTIQPEAFFRWGEELSSADLARIGMEQWSQIQNDMILPQVHYLISQLDLHFEKLEMAQWKEWRSGYLGSLGQLLKSITLQCSQKSQEISDKISEKLDGFLADNWKKEPLSRKSLATVAHTPGVTTVLNGMRNADYVRDSMGILHLRPMEVKATVYEAFQMKN